MDLAPTALRTPLLRLVSARAISEIAPRLALWIRCLPPIVCQRRVANTSRLMVDLLHELHAFCHRGPNKQEMR